MRPEQRLDAFEKSVTNHRPSDEQVAVIEEIRSRAKHLGEVLCLAQPTTREQSLALTKLEEVVMWGVKGVILHGVVATST